MVYTIFLMLGKWYKKRENYEVEIRKTIARKGGGSDMKWEVVKLGAFVKVLSGFAFDSNLFTESKGMPLVRIRDVGRDYSETHFDGTFDNRYVINNGDVLISMDGEFRIAKWQGGKALLNQRVCKIESLDNTMLDAGYLLHYLPFELKKIEDKTSFVTVKHLSVKQINDIQIPLPPLPTQQKIAAILDEADALRRKDKALLAKYDELLQAVFYDMFGDPVKNEKGWEVNTLASVLENIVAGSSYGGEERALANDELGVLKISAVTSGEFKSDEYKAVAISDIKKAVIQPKKDDLLFSRANTRDLVGAMCIVDKDYPRLFLPDKLWRLDLDKKSCSPFYLKNLMAIPDFKEQLTKTATGTSGSMLNISMSKLRDLKIPLPPFELQYQFTTIAQNIQYQKSQIIQQQTHSENLFQSLMQRAFNGELVG